MLRSPSPHFLRGVVVWPQGGLRPPTVRNLAGPPRGPASFVMARRAHCLGRRQQPAPIRYKPTPRRRRCPATVSGAVRAYPTGPLVDSSTCRPPSLGAGFSCGRSSWRGRNDSRPAVRSAGVAEPTRRVNAMDIIGKISGRALADDGKSAPLSADVIFYKGSRWFVPKWIERRSEGLKAPERIVCLDTILYRDVPFGPTQFQLDEPIPRDVPLWGRPTGTKWRICRGASARNPGPDAS